MGFTFTATFSSADAAMTIAAAQVINIPLGENLSGRSDGGVQIVRLFCEFGANTGSATLNLFATENFSSLASATQRKFLVGPATITGTAVRTDSAGTGGNYLATTSFTLTSRDTFDVLMPPECKLYIACTALSNGPLYVRGYVTRANA